MQKYLCSNIANTWNDLYLSLANLGNGGPKILKQYINHKYKLLKKLMRK